MQDNIAELEGIYAETREALTAEGTLAADALSREQDLLVRISELERENALLKEQAALNQAFFAGPDEDGKRIAELEAENARLKAANERLQDVIDLECAEKERLQHALDQTDPWL